MFSLRSVKPYWLLVFAVYFILSGLFPVAAQGPDEAILYQENFDSGQAANWELESGWKVASDSGHSVLSGEGHNWARLNSSLALQGDFRFQFKLLMLRGRIHLVCRLNTQGRYFIGFDENGSGLNKQYWPDTFQNGITDAQSYHALGAWHQVEIVSRAERIELWVDGVQEWGYSDPDPLTYGSFAFETLDGSAAYIDDIVYYGPAPSPETAAITAKTWVRTGGPLGGLGYDIRMRPDNPDVMYVTDSWAGVFTSRDGGRNWSPSNNGITTRIGETGDAIPVFSLTIDPHDYNTLWVGTQNARGIYKSTDGGQNWVEMDNGVVEKSGISFRGFTVDPQSSDVVYAAAELSSWAWAGQGMMGREFDMTKGVVYRTTDGGQTWTAIWRGDNLARYVWIDPRDSNIIYISTGIFDREAANSDPQTGTPGGVGVVKSTDGGQTWTAVTTGLDNSYVGTLFMHPENPDILLAGTGNNQYYDNNGVYLTTDGGAFWQQTLRGENITAIEFALSDPSIAYAGSADAIYRSDDAGQHWQRVAGGSQGWGSPGVRAGFPIDFQVDPRDPNRIFANNYGGGNFVSEDGGHTWATANAGYTGAQVRDIAADPSAPARVYAAARSGLFVSSTGGGDWAGLNFGFAASLEWNAVALDPADTTHILAANNWNSMILKSTDSGQSWSPASWQAGEGLGWREIVFAPSAPTTVYAGQSAFYSAGTFDNRLSSGGIFVSHDGGSTWGEANDATSQDANVIHLAVAPDDPLVVYAATGNRGLLKSVDGGQSWTMLGPGQNGAAPVLSVAVDPQDANHIFAGMEFGGLLHSTDGGQTWQVAGVGLVPEFSISSIVINPTDPQMMYVSDRMSGVYYSGDGGASWIAITNGLRMRCVTSLALSSDGQHLYAATEGEGVYRLDVNDTPPQ